MKRSIILEKVFGLFEEEDQDLKSFLEVPDIIWSYLEKLAAKKQLVLSPYELKTADGKTLVDMETPDQWAQLLTYLDLESIKDSPTRSLTVNDIEQAQKGETKMFKEVMIIGAMGDKDMPDAQQIKDILSSNLKVIKIDVIGEPSVIKTADKFSVEFKISGGENIPNSEIQGHIQQNLDKIFTITSIGIK